MNYLLELLCITGNINDIISVNDLLQSVDRRFVTRGNQIGSEVAVVKENHHHPEERPNQRQ